MTSEDIKSIYVGYDPREHDAYTVAVNSILRRTTSRVLIKPLVLGDLAHLVNPPIFEDGRMYDPESGAPQATEFARTRFAIPFLQRDGWALFVDCDVIAREDIDSLFALADDRYAVMVARHEQKVVETWKMDGQVQTSYPRKNWSSVILWNCSHPAHRRLTKFRLNAWPGRDLHAFKWLTDAEIGSLDPVWNQLVPNILDPDRGILHFTLGGPWLPGWKEQEYDVLWLNEAHDLR